MAAEWSSTKRERGDDDDDDEAKRTGGGGGKAKRQAPIPELELYPVSSLSSSDAVLLAIDFSPQNGERHIAVGTQDGMVQIIDRESGAVVQRVGVSDGIDAYENHLVRYSRDGALLATSSSVGSFSVIEVWETENWGRCQGPVTVHGEVLCGDISPDGRLAIVGNDRGVVYLVETTRVHPAAEPKIIYNAGTQAVPSMQFDPSGGSILVSHSSGVVQRIIPPGPGQGDLWVVAQDFRAPDLEKAHLHDTTAHFLPDGTHVLTTANYGGIYRWGTTTENPTIVGDYSGDGTESMASVSTNPRNSFAVLGMYQEPPNRERVALLNAKSGNIVRRFSTETREDLSALDISPSGRFVAAGFMDEALHVWDLKVTVDRARNSVDDATSDIFYDDLRTLIVQYMAPDYRGGTD